mmetsp:Transcript_7603/g.9472  ORF Transcript_7603/g.9472 Transcript_7603/m.9472 type:complete len:242 (-) Transcript_7603:279-1004(-)
MFRAKTIRNVGNQLTNSLRRFFSEQSQITLNSLRDNVGATRPRKRIGRGIGSGRGKTSGKGHKGQKSRSGSNAHRGHVGGQTPLYKLLPKRGFKSKRSNEFAAVNLRDLQLWLDMGRLTPVEGEPLSMRDLVRSGLVSRVKHGVKLLGDGALEFHSKIDIEVSRASKSAIGAIERAGGTVESVYYNPLGLRALLKPERFDVIPKKPRPPPKLMPLYLDYDRRGYLSPKIQLLKQKRALKIP